MMIASSRLCNPQTMETTWTNPLVDSSAPPADAAATSTGGESPPWDPSSQSLPGEHDAPSASSSTVPSDPYASSSTSSLSYGGFAYGAPELPTVDAGLAHLLPPSYNPLNPSASTSASGYTSQARFNTRTGRYENASDVSKMPDHLSDYSRAKRQNEAFFDQEAWMRERDEEQARLAGEGPAKKKRLTKTEVARVSPACGGCALFADGRADCLVCFPVQGEEGGEEAQEERVAALLTDELPLSSASVSKVLTSTPSSECLPEDSIRGCRVADHASQDLCRAPLFRLPRTSTRRRASLAASPCTAGATSVPSTTTSRIVSITILGNAPPAMARSTWRKTGMTAFSAPRPASAGRRRTGPHSRF